MYNSSRHILHYIDIYGQSFFMHEALCVVRPYRIHDLGLFSIWYCMIRKIQTQKIWTY